MAPKVLQRIVGHEDYATTMKYYMDITEEDTIEEAFKAYEQEISKKSAVITIEENCRYHTR